jgi:hypothetical protein
MKMMRLEDGSDTFGNASTVSDVGDERSRVETLTGSRLPICVAVNRS